MKDLSLHQTLTALGLTTRPASGTYRRGQEILFTGTARNVWAWLVARGDIVASEAKPLVAEDEDEGTRLAWLVGSDGHVVELSEISHATAAVHYALGVGTLFVQPCEDCGLSPLKINGRQRIQAHHHKGYDHEHLLDVQWLCRGCHAKKHGGREEELLEIGRLRCEVATP